MDNCQIITIDGPSGCGKSSVTQIVSSNLGYNWLDSGALYRICAYIKSINPEFSSLDVIKHIEVSDLKFIAGKKGEASLIFLNQLDITKKIRNESVAQEASNLAKNIDIRQKLIKVQRDFATYPGLVAEGRDMGATIFPNANYKFFLTACPKVRAKRRQKQLQLLGEHVSLSALITSIEDRDYRDSNRSLSPLSAPDDAKIVDTSNLSLLEVVDLIMQTISK